MNDVTEMDGPPVSYISLVGDGGQRIELYYNTVCFSGFPSKELAEGAANEIIIKFKEELCSLYPEDQKIIVWRSRPTVDKIKRGKKWFVWMRLAVSPQLPTRFWLRFIKPELAAARSTDEYKNAVSS